MDPFDLVVQTQCTRGTMDLQRPFAFEDGLLDFVGAVGSILLRLRSFGVRSVGKFRSNFRTGFAVPHNICTFIYALYILPHQIGQLTTSTHST